MKAPNPPGGHIRSSAMRLRGMLCKEALQILRDPSSIAIAFVLPLVLLLIFGYGVSLDARHIPVGLVVEQPSTQIAGFTAAFARSEYFVPKSFAAIQEAEDAMRRGEIDAILWFRHDFEARLLSSDGVPVGIFLNGVDANTARMIQGYLEGIWATWLQQSALEEGLAPQTPVVMENRVWFNAEMRSRNFLVPGLIAVIMTLIGALLTAMVVAREWERGTMEALMATPVTVPQILLGKLVPYFILGMGGMLLSLGMAVWLFEVPLRGSLAVLLGSAMLFLVVALGMGLLISTIARNQFVAGQAAIIATFLPAFILSGFIFDVGSMPNAIQWITHLIAARYFVAILQTVFLAGDVWPVILWNAAALALMALIFLALVRRHTVKRLE